jgi:hypothetical protein
MFVDLLCSWLLVLKNKGRWMSRELSKATTPASSPPLTLFTYPQMPLHLAPAVACLAQVLEQVLVVE